MARMIPPACGAQAPVGERDLFDRLKRDPDTDGWVVMHSLDLKRHQSKIEGELDVVVLVPGLGVLCIEVKGCTVSRRDGKWIYPYETSFEGPFKQASSAMHSLRKYLGAHDPTLSRLLFFSAVVFTRIPFDEQSPEWHKWQYINSRDFVRHPISFSVRNILQRAHSHVLGRAGRDSWYCDNASRPTISQISRIVALARDDFEYSVSPRRDIELVEQSIKLFTEEQFDALDLLQDNERVVFRGPAGTGKTFIAMEAVKRALADGMSVLFVCYNSLLGDWLRQQTSDYKCTGMFQCRTLHSLLLEISGELLPRAPRHDYWCKALPEQALSRLLDDDFSQYTFDLLVVDEAQDVLQTEYLDVLDLLLKGGLAGGKWAFMGDFERQAIYLSDGGATAAQALLALTARSPSHVNFSLRTNCRNAEPIAQTLVVTSGLTPGYRRVLHDIEGADVDPLFYSSAENQRRQLVSALSDLRRTFRAPEIVVLSMRGDENACAAVAASEFVGSNLAPIRQVCDVQTIPFSSVHSFKGLEASAVIITDVENLGDERTRALLYVGMSRARVRLFILMHQRCRASYNHLLDTGLEITSRK